MDIKKIGIQLLRIGCLLFLFANVFALPLHLINKPPGFNVSIYAKVDDARQMALGKDNVIFVGTRSGKVYALLPSTTSEIHPLVIARGLNGPNGVAYRDGTLYVAEINRVLKYENVDEAILKKVPITPKIFLDSLPKETHHGYRYIKFSPEGDLYISVGVPCNRCLVNPPYGTILRVGQEGKQVEVFARGIRNSMGFDWDPVTKKLWFTDNGADWLGNNFPPDELNFAPEKAMHFGFPFYNANEKDSTYYRYHDSKEHYYPPVLNLEAHVAALGMVFYDGKMFPPDYHHKILIAEHGSWNRLQKSGYKIIAVDRVDSRLAARTFIDGWLQGQTNWGRPVDLLVMRDGSLLISDDYAGVIYRVSY